ncbi:MAG: hypothetical protein LBG05_09690 [Treponema sp.]|jgi:hypothetical protein|nr:hypothetical protein [Treponema sp.]
MELDISITADDFSALIDNGLRIIIARPLEDAEPNVSWLVFNPYMKNTVQWAEEYGLYASTVKVQKRKIITPIGELPPKVLDGKSYLFGDGQKALFSEGTDPCDSGSFAIKNLMTDPPQLSFGLTQKAQVNGMDIAPSPINAVSVLSHYTATFTPLPKVYVWLETSLDTGIILNDVKSALTEVDFDASNTKKSLTYDSNQGCFVASSNGVKRY